jgi:hypothetical protein
MRVGPSATVGQVPVEGTVAWSKSGINLFNCCEGEHFLKCDFSHAIVVSVDPFAVLQNQ